MNDEAPRSLETCFSDLPDPRVQGRWDHKLMDILIIAVCAALCGADSWVRVETVARAKEAWFRQFLKLGHGIPSHDTFGDVVAKIDSEAFQVGFIRWVESVFRVTKGQAAAINAAREKTRSTA